MFTGWRPEEACKLNWRQVSKDFKDVTWDDSEAAANLKGAKKQYRFPLNTEATKVLQSIKSYNFDSEYVFPANNLTSHVKQNPTQYVDIVQQEVGNGKRYTLGIYRKTFQTYAHKVGIDDITIKRLVFHTQKFYDVQSGYIKAHRETLREKSQKIADYILELAKRIDAEKIGKIEIKENLHNAMRELAKKNKVTEKEMIERVIETGIKFISFEI